MRTISMLVVLGALACTSATPSRAQDIICCMTIIKANGDWFGAIRLDNCQDWFNKVPPPTLELLCTQRNWLTCIDTSRCDSLPPKPDKPPTTGTGKGPLLPPTTDPERDGVADGFGPKAPTPSTTPPAGGVSPPRLAYIVRARSSSGGPPLIAFTVFLDRAACAVPLADDGQPAKKEAVAHVVRGRIVHVAGRVRVEAEASPAGGGPPTAKGTGESAGNDRAAVAAATRAAAVAMKLACAR